MGDSTRGGPGERDIEQAVTALKKGATLLKYGRRGKPKFCPFRLSNDESVLIWYSGKEEKQLKLSQVSRIIPGQRTVIFKRYPRPEKEYQSFSLIYNDNRSLDLICKDKDVAEVWFVGVKALISNNGWRKWRNEARDSSTSSADGSINRRIHQTISSHDAGDAPCHVPIECPPQIGLGKAFSDIMLYTAASNNCSQAEVSTYVASFPPSNTVENFTGRNSSSESIRISSSSLVSSSSQGSFPDDFDSLGDVFMWGEGICQGIMGGVSHNGKFDANLPKALESTVVLDVHHISCGVRHAVLVNRQGEIFSWGEELGGRLGHGVEVDVSNPKLIEGLSGMNIELVACGEYHTSAITTSGDLFTWGGGTWNPGMLGHISEAGHWIPKRVSGPLEGIHVSYASCGPWHTAVVLSTGQLFTFGDGTFGVLGHGDRGMYSLENVQKDYRLKKQRVHAGLWMKEIELLEEAKLGGGTGDDIDKLLDSCSEIFDSASNNLNDPKVPSTSEFKNKPDGWESTSKAEDGNVWEMSQREEDILLQEFERRMAFCKFQIASFIKTHIFSRRRPIDGWRYMIEVIGPNARKGKGSVSRLPGLADPATQPFTEDRPPRSGGRLSRKPR